MSKLARTHPFGWSHSARPLACALSASALCVLLAVPSAGALGVRRTRLLDVAPPAKLSVSATLSQCLPAESQEERSATFAGEMTAIAGTARMEMRIDVLERIPGETSYHAVSAPGLGVWRSSAPGVKVYRYLKQVTNLAGPAFYRAAVRFRWLNAKGHLIAATEDNTRRCEQPGAPASGSVPTPAQPSPPAPGSTSSSLPLE